MHGKQLFNYRRCCMADTKTHETEPNLNKEYIKIDGANRSGPGRELTLLSKH